MLQQSFDACTQSLMFHCHYRTHTPQWRLSGNSRCSDLFYVGCKHLWHQQIRNLRTDAFDELLLRRGDEHAAVLHELSAHTCAERHVNHISTHASSSSESSHKSVLDFCRYAHLAEQLLSSEGDKYNAVEIHTRHDWRCCGNRLCSTGTRPEQLSL